jgi:hypothetical protein
MPQRFTIGRERACDIAIADDSVSRTHAEIWLEDDGTLMLADHGSSNGTELIRAGEESALTTAALLPGDQVRFGAVTLTVKDLIDAIEAKSPGALTGSRSRPPQAAKPAPAAPPSPPPIPDRSPAPPPIAAPPPPRAVAPQAPQQAQVQSPPPLPKPVAAPPPVPQVIPPIPGGQPMPPPVPPPAPQRAAAPPPIPSIPDRPPAVRPAPPPPPPPPIPERQQVLDPFPPQRPAGTSASPVVRCECGAIKTQGQVCPACHR